LLYVFDVVFFLKPQRYIFLADYGLLIMYKSPIWLKKAVFGEGGKGVWRGEKV
jgi:hypothetical protein